MPLTFGVWSPVCGGSLRLRSRPEPPTPQALVTYAAFVERLGYEAYYVPEHHLNALYGPEHDVVDGWVLSSAVAAQTSRLRVVCAVQPGFKSPGAVAKMAATIAQFRPGCLGLSILAGWWQGEVESYGDVWLPHAQRYARAGEFVEVLRGLWGEQPFSHHGQHYRVESAYLRPRPEPLPSLTIAGESEAAIELCARLGDVLFVNGGELERVAELATRVKQRALEQGRTVQVAMSAFGLVRASEREVESALGELTSQADLEVIRYFDAQLDGAVVAHNRGTESDRIEANLGLAAGLVGTPARILDKLAALEEAGVDAVVLKFEPAQSEAELFARHVLAPYRRRDTTTAAQPQESA